MIERKFVSQNIKEFQIQEYISSTLKNVGHSHTRLQRTPLGEKIIIYTSRPGLIVGRKGENIKKLTKNLKKKFELENPQIEISEVDQIMLDPKIVAERIASSLERFGSQRFKGIGHKTMEEVIQAGGLGIEIIISGKIPGSRAKSWRFYKGYLKKCGNLAMTGVRTAQAYAQLKTGTIGVKISIMPKDVKFPDRVVLKIGDPPSSSQKPEQEQKTKVDPVTPSQPTILEQAGTIEEKPKEKKSRKPSKPRKKAAKDHSNNSPSPPYQEGPAEQPTFSPMNPTPTPPITSESEAGDVV